MTPLAGGPGLSANPGPPAFVSRTGVPDDVCEVVVPEVESVIGQFQRSPCGLLAAEVAELAGNVIGQRPCAVLAGEVLHRQQVEPGVEGARRRVGAARSGVVVAVKPAAVVGLLDPWQVGLETGDRVGSGYGAAALAQAVRR